MRFARAVELEPGTWFRPAPGARPTQWWGVERIVSRFAGKRRVRVLCSPGPSFVCDADKAFEVIDWSGGK